MARQLWLLRHADAARLQGGSHGAREDSERPLTERGVGQARAAGVALERMDVAFEAVLFSPKVRARQTAELAGGFDGAQALDAMASVGADGRLLMVGHEPDLSRVIAELTGARVDLKKGGLAIVR